MRKVENPFRLVLSDDDKNVYRPVHRYDILIDAELDHEGQVRCAEPLAGFSLYWPYALDAIEQNKEQIWHGRPGRVLVSFEDPAFVGGNHFRWAAEGRHPCQKGEALSSLLLQGALHLDDDSAEAALHCFSLALRIEPNSLAANYGTARANAQLKRHAEEAHHLNTVVSLKPTFYEAWFDLAFARALALGGGPFVNREQSSVTLTKLVEMKPPLPTRERAYDDLVFLYDRLNDPERSLASKRALIRTLLEIRARHAPLVSPFTLWSERKDLALRLEERGLFDEALAEYEAALVLSKHESIHEAYRFDTGLGRVRVLKQKGRFEEATASCAALKRRIPRTRRRVENAHWGGRAVTEAKLEATCGDFTRAVQMLLADASRRPDSEIPYRALALIFRTRGERELANRYAELAEKVQSAREAAILQDILREAEELARSGKVQKLP